MSIIVRRSQIGKFEVRLHQDGTIIHSYGGTRLQSLEYDTAEDALPVFNTICEVVRDTVMCMNQDMTNGQVECDRHVPEVSSTGDICSSCGATIDND